MTSSPGETRLATADSRPPVPDDVSRSRSFDVLNTRFAPDVISPRIAANSGPRWSIMGRFMLRTTRSGRGVGPGIRSWVWKAMRLVRLGRVREQRDRARALEGCGQRALMPRTGPGDAAREDLAAVADKAPQAGNLLVIDVV